MHRSTCTHPSAFCLMRYQTPDRNVEELIWNSRDQAVPAEIPLGKLTLAHADPHRDEFKPFHVPRVGSRMWIDPLLDRAESLAADYFAAHQHDEDFAPTYGATEREALAKLTEKFRAELLAPPAGDPAATLPAAPTGPRPGPVLVVVTTAAAARIATALESKGAR